MRTQIFSNILGGNLQPILKTGIVGVTHDDGSVTWSTIKPEGVKLNHGIIQVSKQAENTVLARPIQIDSRDLFTGI